MIEQSNNRHAPHVRKYCHRYDFCPFACPFSRYCTGIEDHRGCPIYKRYGSD